MPEQPQPQPESDLATLLKLEHERTLHVHGYRPTACIACWPEGAPAPLSEPAPGAPTAAAVPEPATPAGFKAPGDSFARIRARQALATGQEPGPDQPEPRVVCEHCHDRRFVRRDVPFGDPDFGKAQPCQKCYRPSLLRARTIRLLELARVPDAYRAFTLENFPISDASRRSYEEVCDWWQRLRTGTLPPEHSSLFLWGKGTGLGKTSLACSVMAAWSIQQANGFEIDGQPGHLFVPGGGDPTPGASHPIGSICAACGAPPERHPHEGYYLQTIDAFDAIRDTFNDNTSGTTREMMDAIGTAPFLILDDLGTETPTLFVSEKLHQMINRRHDARLPTIFTSNLGLDQLEENYGRLAGQRDRGGASRASMEIAALRGQRILWRIVEMSTVIEMRGDNLRDPTVRDHLGLATTGGTMPLPLEAARPAAVVSLRGRIAHPSEEEPRTVY